MRSAKEIESLLDETLEEISRQKEALETKISNQGTFSRIFRRGLNNKRQVRLASLHSLETQISKIKGYKKENVSASIHDIVRSFNQASEDLRRRPENRSAPWAGIISNVEIISASLTNYLNSPSSSGPKSSNASSSGPSRQPSSVASSSGPSRQPSSVASSSGPSRQPSSVASSSGPSRQPSKIVKKSAPIPPISSSRSGLDDSDISSSEPSQKQSVLKDGLQSISLILVASIDPEDPYHQWAERSDASDELKQFSTELKNRLERVAQYRTFRQRIAPPPPVEFFNAVKNFNQNPNYLVNLLSEPRFKKVSQLFIDRIDFLKAVNESFSADPAGQISRERPKL